MSLLLVKEIPQILSCKYTLFYLCFMVLFQISSAFAFEKSQVVDLSSLGAFELKFSTVKKANFMVGQHLIGEVSYKPGDTIASVEGYRAFYQFEVLLFFKDIEKLKDILKPICQPTKLKYWITPVLQSGHF
ncbi:MULTISPECIES: DUF3240 family protein [unclassified Colwellia]|uniref:DUF3240 family protein n=1 Tax=unclassified Colwellia TaxID=196834 RepID=UPI00217535E4|nr:MULTISPECIES: DUF3240 family protein [unclassified Colwellia]